MTVQGLLANSRAHFYHATCLRGLAAYCRSRAILSRKRWMEADPEYTAFWSDESDEQIGVLSRVFGNVYDFGAIFARASCNSSPNVYGPITLEFSQGVFREMIDIVLTKESVGKMTRPCSWREDALSIEQVQEMLRGDSFNHPIAEKYHYTEISCENETIGFSNLEKVIVEPICIGSTDLVLEVSRLFQSVGVNVRVEARAYRATTRKKQYQELATALWNLAGSDGRRKVTLNDLPMWVKEEQLRSRFVIWAEYFYNGTACYLRETC